MLGTVAGYREFDVSTPFMIALPIFAALLISDGGYGAVLFFIPLLLYNQVARKFGPHFTRLIIVVGAVSLLWGVINATFFGKVFYDPLIPVNAGEYSRSLMMKISFYMGAIHLSIGQFWNASALYPDWRFLSKVGWGIFTWGMLGVVQMFVLQTPFNWQTPWPYLLIVGAMLAILFTSPNRNILKMVGFGVADFPLSMLNTFSDVISYVRLMAVGLASTALATNFNELAAPAPIPLAILILVIGHGLNISLGLVALFAHGVRLNMLEFSNTLGMQWIGYPYKPFLKRTTQES
jgi:V/A-type H+-transporting ATPase subunit I